MKYETTSFRVVGGEEINSVLARELHVKLEVKTKFVDWIKQRIERCMLERDVDFMVVWNEPKKKFVKSEAEMLSVTGSKQAASKLGWQSDYVLTVRAAKEISMSTGGTKGKESRKYFLDLEEEMIRMKIEAKSETPAIPQTFAEALMLAAQLEAEKEQALLEVKRRDARLQKKDEIIKDTARVLIENGNVLIGDFSKNISIPGLGRTNLFRWLRASNILTHDNKPYHTYVDRGYFVMKPVEKKINGYQKYTTYLTPKGTIWLTGVLRKKFGLED